MLCFTIFTDPPETASTSQSANGTQPVNITQSANGTQPVSTTQSANGTQPVTTTKAANSTQSASTTQATTTAISKPQTSMPSKPNITVTTASTPSTSASVSVTGMCLWLLFICYGTLTRTVCYLHCAAVFEISFKLASPTLVLGNGMFPNMFLGFTNSTACWIIHFQEIILSELHQCNSWNFSGWCK